MAFTDIDVVNGYTIRRLHNAEKTKFFGCISGRKGPDNNLTEVVEHMNLTEARNYRGFKVKEAEKTPPKSSYPQNQKGYKASNRKK